MANDTARVKRIALLLDEHIEELAGLGFDSTAALLRIARLDLQMRMHAITDGELRALCDVLEDRKAPSQSSVVMFPERVSLKRRRAR